MVRGRDIRRLQKDPVPVVGLNVIVDDRGRKTSVAVVRLIPMNLDPVPGVGIDPVPAYLHGQGLCIGPAPDLDPLRPVMDIIVGDPHIARIGITIVVNVNASTAPVDLVLVDRSVQGPIIAVGIDSIVHIIPNLRIVPDQEICSRGIVLGIRVNS